VLPIEQDEPLLQRLAGPGWLRRGAGLISR
jgi:hypothetical protein